MRRTPPPGKVGTPASAPISTPAPVACLKLGFAEETEWLGAGLRGDGLHEIYAAAPNSTPTCGLADGAAALGFALLLAELQRQQTDATTLIWARESGAPGAPYGPGLAELGCDPATITLLNLPDGKAVLRAGLDALRSGAATVLIELHGRQPLLDLTATRRLALAASETGTLALVLRGGTTPTPSAAHSRWQIAAAPSVPPSPADAYAGNAPGRPAFALTLLRQRGGRDGLHLILEWDRNHAAFQERLPTISPPAIGPIDGQPAPLFGAVLAVAASRAGLPRKTGTGG